jgi:tRNA (mo5U34)-methyltransferase
MMEVYDIEKYSGRFDLVLFMGVFYHLRHPLLALDAISKKVGRLMIFQTLTMPGEETYNYISDFGIHQREIMLEPGWPKMAFIENSLNGDPTNWWAPNHSAVMAMLRSSGFHNIERTAHEIYICRVEEYKRI